MKIKFTKMHGAGNDFVMLDGVHTKFSLNKDQLKLLADRHFGVGADQILLVEPSELPNVDFKYRIFNQDGGEVEQCGNGARCFVRFVHDLGLTKEKRIRVQTMSKVIEPELVEENLVKVNMEVPSFDPKSLPFVTEGLPTRIQNNVTQWAVEFEGQLWWFSICSMGNPHITIFVESIENAPVEKLGAFIENHPAFPSRVNVGFLEIQSYSNAKIRVWERGAGETLACGTGACAAALTAIRTSKMSSPVTIQTKGGQLKILWEGGVSPVYLIGPATKVFESEIDL